MLHVLFVLLAGSACGGSEQRTPPPTAGGEAGQLEMAAPDDGPTQTLEVLRTVPTGQVTEPGVEPREPVESGRIIAEPTSPGRDVSFDGDRFAAAGFRIEGVPEGTRFRRVALDPPTWEVVDRRGRRAALVQAAPLARAAGRPEGPREDSLRVARWGGGPARIVVERFFSETHVFRIERRARGTGWVRAGFRAGD
jgi:hypothetical protein